MINLLSKLLATNCCFSLILHDLLFQISNRSEAHLELNSLRRKNDCALIIKGDSLEVSVSRFKARILVELQRKFQAFIGG